MFKQKYTLIGIIILCSLHASAEMAVPGNQPLSLFQAIKIGVANNPGREANTLLVGAAYDEARAARLNAYYPSLSIYSGVSRNGVGPYADSRGEHSEYAGAAIGLTVYDGGARKNSVKAQDLRVEALAAQFNSTDSRIDDTAGAIASQIFQTYLEASIIKTNGETNEQFIGILNRIAPFLADTQSIAKLNNALITYKSNADSAKESLENVRGDLQHVIYTELTADIETMEQTNASMRFKLEPFSDVDFAIQHALKNNQNYLAKLYELQATEASARATKAELTRPTGRIVFNDTWSRSNPYDDGGIGSYSSRDAAVSLEVSYQFQAGVKSTLRAAQSRVRAAQNKTDKQTEDFSFEIRSQYNKLAANERTLESYRMNVADFKMQINSFLQKNTSPGTIIAHQDFDFFMEVLGSLDNSYNNYYNSLFGALQHRYVLLREIGILLDQSEITDFDKFKN